MMENNVFFIMPKTKEEALAVNELLSKMREQRLKEEQRQKAKMAISFEISNAIAEIGLPEVKNIVRELNRELRELKE